MKWKGHNNVMLTLDISEVVGNPITNIQLRQQNKTQYILMCYTWTNISLTDECLFLSIQLLFVHTGSTEQIPA